MAVLELVMQDANSYEGKKCNRCGKMLPLSDFSKSRLRKYHYECKKCVNKLKHIKTKKVAKHIVNLKLQYGCASCGYNSYAVALDFHHIDPSKKEKSLSTSRGVDTWQSMYNEIKKCVILCTRCHRELHAGVYSASKLKKIYSKVVNNLPGEQFKLWW